MNFQAEVTYRDSFILYHSVLNRFIIEWELAPVTVDGIQSESYNTDLTKFDKKVLFYVDSAHSQKYNRD